MKQKVLSAARIFLALCGFILFIWVFLTITDLPDVSVLRHYRPAAAAEAVDVNGRVLTQYFDRTFRIWAPLSSLPEKVVQAVTTAEDDTFFEHRGVNYRATWEAFVHDVKKGRFARGGSTITQQMIKNVLLSREKTLSRKLREFILARQAEKTLTKRQILEIYLNVVEWGENIYGIEAASRFYLDKHAAELTASEAALLAGMLPNPRYFNPYKRMEKAKDRQERVLFNMFQAKLLTGEEYDAARRSPLRLREESSGRFDLSAVAGTNGRPCYLKVLEQVLLSRYGEQGLYREGLRIRTTIDKSLQDRFSSAHHFPDSVTVIRDKGEVRAVACTDDEDAVRSILEYSGPPYDGYEYGVVSVDSIGPEEVVIGE